MKLARKASGLVKSLRTRKLRALRAEESDDVGSPSLSSIPVVKAPARRLDKQERANSTAAPATGKRKRGEMGYDAINIHEDAREHDYQAREHRKMQAVDDSQVVSEGEGGSADESASGTDSEDEVDDSVMDDMRKLEETFQGISQRYKLVNRIGEGTFSTVYKAQELKLVDDEDIENESEYDLAQGAKPLKRRKLNNASSSRSRPRSKPTYVALKKIYVTSSPNRILNELELLHQLRDSDYVCPLLTAFRHQDQVVAVLPYFRHLDFRLYYREFLVNDIRAYFRSLFRGLAHVHRKGILHRDIKPTNFLYDQAKKTGVLVDFGLAEKQGTDWQPCLCQDAKEKRRERFLTSYAISQLEQTPELKSLGHPKQETRPSRRANRAGTRGFRAPEVLFKCTSQTTKIDIWSAGVILLTMLARRFPFFNSSDDVDAMIEISSIFGKKRMQSTAALHGQVFETTIETIGEKGFTLEKIILWASCRDKVDDRLRAGETQAVNFLEGLLQLEPSKRLSAKQALEHKFFTGPVEDEVERTEREDQEAREAEAVEERCH